MVVGCGIFRYGYVFGVLWFFLVFFVDVYVFFEFRGLFLVIIGYVVVGF